MNLCKNLKQGLTAMILVFVSGLQGVAHAQQQQTISPVPLFLTQGVTPMVMLSMSNDHQLYFEAYPDYADLTGNGLAERTYNHDIDYYGYFDTYKCYTYSDSRFEPKSINSDKYCTDSEQWSGNFLNYVSMGRIDVIRKILYGGYRSADTKTSTILERTYLPNDGHSWVRYYDGNDLHLLTPFNLPPATSTTSITSRTVPAGSRNNDDDQQTFRTGWNAHSQVQIGDQLRIQSQGVSGVWMLGVVRSFDTGTGDVNVQVTSSSGVGNTRNDWQIVNNSRRGVSFCNTTVAPNGTFSQDVTAPPLIRVARGNYSLWAANERHQCRWSDEVTRSGHEQMRIGGERFSNGNDISSTGIPANSDNPVRANVGLGTQNYIVRVNVCVSETLVGDEQCQKYPDGNLKPVGLLQTYGEGGTLNFGLLTGSYMHNKSGGVMRKLASSMANEINFSTDGTFKTMPATGGIIGTLDLLRIYGYRHHTGTGGNDATYNSSSTGGDNCPWGLNTFTNGRCTNWGNPQSEIFLENLRYLAGKQPSTAFRVTDTDRITGLPALATWQDPLNNDNWCASLNVINFNSSVVSYDADQLDGVTNIGATNASALTNIVGTGEGIHGKDWFVGEVGTANNQLCTAKNVGALGGVFGLCPEAPRLSGSFHIAGLAHYAYTQSIRNDLVNSSGEQVDIQVKTYGVTLAPAVPRIEIPKPGETKAAVTLLPACRNSSVGGNCAIVDLKIIDQNVENGTGSFLVQWEDSEQGGDYDMDMNGILSYVITDNDIRVTTNVFSQSTGYAMGFGYVISGTNQDGFHVHSGINRFNYGTVTTTPRCNDCVYNDFPTSHVFALGDDSAGLLEDPLYYAAKWGGFRKPARTSDPKFPDEIKSWDMTGDGLPDNYYFAINPAKLASDLAKVFKDVAASVASASSVATNSTQLRTGTIVYQARFNSEDWSGQLLALPVNEADGNVPRCTRWDLVDCTYLWEVGQKIPTNHNERKIFTINDETHSAVSFEWGALSEAQQAHLQDDENVLLYLRGNRAGEIKEGGVFRNRNSVLGDIVNSDPAFMGSENFGFSVLPGVQGATYDSYLNAKQAKPPMLFFGANDGMLHAIKAETGEEVFAYVPKAIFQNLTELTKPDYAHQYFVDGSPSVVDAYVGSWKTFLIGSTGAGGRSVFLLDVTNSDSFVASDIKWEFTSDDDSDLGYTIPQPTIARLNDGHFWAIFANGYNSPDGKAVLFLKNLTNGNVVKIDTGAGPDANMGPNGLSAPIPVDVTVNRSIDYIYAGDLHGNLWKFDVSSTVSSAWSVAFGTDKPLFKARYVDEDEVEHHQPITARPEVGRHPSTGHLMIYFGTGKYFHIGDTTDNSVQSLYGIRDRGNEIEKTDRSTLIEQTILAEGKLVLAEKDLQGEEIETEKDWRVVSNEAFDTQDGWYLDLISPVSGIQGERVATNPILRLGRIIFTTLIPSQHPCDFGGTGWLMELDMRSGGRLDYSVFDVNEDGQFDGTDFVKVTVDGQELIVPTSGLKSDVGIIQRPRVVEAGPVEYKYVSGSTGVVDVIKEKGADDRGRQSWRQLR